VENGYGPVFCRPVFAAVTSCSRGLSCAAATDVGPSQGHLYSRWHLKRVALYSSPSGIHDLYLNHFFLLHSMSETFVMCYYKFFKQLIRLKGETLVFDSN